MVLRTVAARSLRGGCAVVALSVGVAVFAAGCLRRPAVVRVPEPQQVAIAIVVDAEDGSVREPPQAFRDEVARRLQERNLVPEFVAFSAYSDAFSRARDTSRRYAYLRKLSPSAPLLLLIETRAQFFSHLNGRFRWNVSAKASAGRAHAEVAPVSGADELGAILQFNHEREPEALANVAPTIAEHTGILFDSFLLLPELDAPASPAPAAPTPTPPAEGATPAKTGAVLGASGPIYFVMVDRFANGNPANDGPVDLEDPQGFMVAISRE